MNWDGYFGIENLGLDSAQKQALIAALKLLGVKTNPQPFHLNHWRYRTDNNAVIFDAKFNQTHLTIDAVKGYLANIFSIQASSIMHTVAQSKYGPVIKFIYNGDRLRMIPFAGVGSTWEESRAACKLYLADNKAAWETE